MSLSLRVPAAALVADLVDIESVSGNERPIADAIWAALRADAPHLELSRVSNTIIARTDLGRDQRVVIAGHHDTVPVNGNFPGRVEGAGPDDPDAILWGIGSCDMKGGLAVGLRLAHLVADPRFDLTFIFYEAEEVEADRSGLRLVEISGEPEHLEADFAVLMEPTDGAIEGGCQGTARLEVRTHGERAHSARSWTGHNAIHDAAPVLARLAEYEPRRPVVDGLRYHEGLNAVRITGGVANNVIPDACQVSVNYRFAPDRDLDQAYAHLQEVFDGFDLELSDGAAGARPGLDLPMARSLVAAVGGEPKPKLGWTDVARFAARGVPAVNYGPGDPLFAHKADEHVRLAQVTECETRMLAWLTEETA